jgi:hypothetical protein
VFFSLSLVQFSFTLTAKESKNEEDESYNSVDKWFFGSEIWALCFILLVQEIPFLVMRIAKLIKYQSSLKDYSICYYVAKNFLLCIFEIYRIGVLYMQYRRQLRLKRRVISDKKEKKSPIKGNDINLFSVNF